MSEVVGVWLRDKNLGIFDLSDLNCFLKLNEKIGGMLYDKKRVKIFREVILGSIDLILIILWLFGLCFGNLEEYICI